MLDALGTTTSAKLLFGLTAGLAATLSSARLNVGAGGQGAAGVSLGAGAGTHEGSSTSRAAVAASVSAFLPDSASTATSSTPSTSGRGARLHQLSRQRPNADPHVAGQPAPKHSSDHPTLGLIATRLRSGSQPGHRADGAKLGLIVEGGGMRGCISGSMLMTLHELGISDAFDVVYGASAGAINATYFITHQRTGLDIYAEDLTGHNEFLNMRNLFNKSGRPAMDLDFLIDHVMNHRKPLDWDAVLASPIQLKVVASCLGTYQSVLLSDFHDRHELAAALKASAAVPQIAGGPRTVRGRKLVDAAVFEPVPVRSAIADGCTHLLVLCTRTAPVAGTRLGKRVRTTLEALTKTTVLNAPYMGDAWRVALSPPMSSQDEELGATLEACPHQVRSGMGAYVLPLYPPTTAGCHPLCLDPAKLRAAAAVGREAMLGLLGPVAAEAGRWSPLAAALEPAAEVAEAEGSFGDAVIYSEAMGQGMRFRP
ncbi:hypothetical protein HYH03_012545 [Edaphochlamys debaryana]|uniref:Patatin n=1 Tax=Edaphochlamys debaryana TaxID=47281 RepID=A0A836BVD1_9CHLO|nr:hypothetical protein HYH03_012545 [Edaphochlamys debaryana]|eukprot:KAG2488923.1 hypothetical protein HYH03_012545 [Edaphochlamys debaryana]